MADLITTADLPAALAARDDAAALVSAASRWVERYCRRTFAQAEVTEKYDGRNLPRIWLDRTPVVEVASVTVNGAALDNSQGMGWTFDPDTGELLRGPGTDDPRFAPWFPRGRRNVEVTYTGGYEPIPDDVQRATLICVQHLADGSEATGVIRSESVGAYSYTLADPSLLAFPPLAASLLPAPKDPIL